MKSQCGRSVCPIIRKLGFRIIDFRLIITVVADTGFRIEVHTGVLEEHEMLGSEIPTESQTVEGNTDLSYFICLLFVPN